MRNIRALRCHVYVSDLLPVIAEDCEIDTIWFHRGRWGEREVGGCAFKHVVIKGNVTGGVRFLPSPDWFNWASRYVKGQAGPSALDRLRGKRSPEALRPGPQNPYATANAAYYSKVDWALDVREARFTGVELSRSGIPARLIRRDPETQVAVRRSVLLDSDWRKVLDGTVMYYAVEQFLDAGFDDGVMVAAKRSRRFSEDLRDIELLRTHDLCDPD